MNTAQDVVDYLLTTTGGGALDGEHKAVRQAVISGIRDLFQARSWLWHTKSASFTTQAVSTTVTGMTAGSKTMTFASTSNMAVGRILDFPAGYFSLTVRVAGISGNTVTVDQPALQTLNVLGTVAAVANLPAASNTLGDAYNVTAGGALYRWNGSAWETFSTPTVLVQTFYDLPPNVKDIDSLMTETVGTLHYYVTPQEWQQLQVNTRGAGEPYYYTVMRSDVNPDRYQIRFVGVPTNGTVVFYIYRYIPDPVKYLGFETSCRAGTVTTNNTTTVTGNGTQFPEDVGYAVIRFGSATKDADPLGSLTPYVHERVIKSVAGGTITVDTAVPTLTNVKYAISNILDCSPQMYTAVLSASEMWYARIIGKNATEAIAIYNRDLRVAMENDVVSPLGGRMYTTHNPTPRTMGYHSPLQGDVG